MTADNSYKELLKKIKALEKEAAAHIDSETKLVPLSGSIGQRRHHYRR
jgi:hypothetical protein